MTTSTLQAVMIDQREPPWVQRLTFGGAATSITLLDAGDIWVATDNDLLVIERKTADDLLNTIGQGRLLPQCAELVKISRYAYLVITGALAPDANGKAITGRGTTGWSWASVQGALLSAQELGVQIVHFGQDSDFERAVLWLAGRRREPVMLIAPVKTPQLLSVGEAILASLPGIGLEKAQALLAYCGSPAQTLAFLTDLTNDNGHVDGIGTVTKQKIRAALGVPEWAELALIASNQESGVRGQDSGG